MLQKMIELIASPNIDVYTEKQNQLGSDAHLVRLEQCQPYATQPIPGPMPGYTCIGHITTFPRRTSTWWAMMARDEDAAGIMDRYRTRSPKSSTGGTPPNTSIVLTVDELAFINDQFGGSKSAAIHAALTALKRSE